MTGRVRVDLSRRFNAGTASNYIRHFDLRSGDKAVLCCRVSSCQQNRTGKLDRQEAALRAEMVARGIIVVGCVCRIGSGVCPIWIGRAVAIARLQGATLVAETTDRLIRSSSYDNLNQDAQAVEDDLEELALFADGVPMATLLHPDASPAQVRSYQRKRGQAATGRRGGRPPAQVPRHCKLVRRQWCPKVLRLHRAGMPAREIARQTDVPEATVRRWIIEWT